MRLTRTLKQVIFACSILASVNVAGVFAQNGQTGHTSKANENGHSLKLQTSCPAMGGEIDKTQFVDYKDQRIYVCCEGCLAQVKKNPEAMIRKLAEMGQVPETIALSATGKVKPGKIAAKDTPKKVPDHHTTK